MKMRGTNRRVCVLALAALAAFGTRASWYWPFGSDEDVDDPKRPRLSELMEPASILIDEATDLAEDGKSVEAIEKYRAALAALDAIEAENRDRASKPEFATLRNKRAYVNATIDSLLLMQVKANARAVAVSDTTALERRLAEERAKKAGKALPSGAETEATVTPAAPSREQDRTDEATPRAEKRPSPSTPVASKKVKAATKPLSRRAQVMADLAAGDYAAAELVLAEILGEKPDDVAALNLQAALETSRGDFKAAERALDRAISVHPRNHYAYYNMANLILRTHPSNKAGAQRYYDTGRSVGGPRNEALERRLK